MNRTKHGECVSMVDSDVVCNVMLMCVLVCYEKTSSVVLVV